MAVRTEISPPLAYPGGALFLALTDGPFLGGETGPASKFPASEPKGVAVRVAQAPEKHTHITPPGPFQWIAFEYPLSEFNFRFFSPFL